MLSCMNPCPIRHVVFSPKPSGDARASSWVLFFRNAGWLCDQPRRNTPPLSISNGFYNSGAPKGEKGKQGACTPEANFAASQAVAYFSSHPPIYEKDTKIFVWNCALHSASDVVFDCCAHAHIGGGGEESGTASSNLTSDHVSRFNKLELPHLPEMVFPDNVLLLKHCNGCILEFNALDALTSVSIGKLILKIACSDSWKESRQETMTSMNEVKPFDWTFSTNYSGTVLGNFVVSSTAERIDMDKLRQKEQILFYEDLILFEDELHDNGVATCSVKIRVMPSSFFILLRFFLRVDNVMLKVNDTRIYHEFGTDYVLREYTSKEAKVQDLKVPAAMLTEPNEVAQMLPLVSSSFEKLSFPVQSN
uniref:TIP41-like protein n=1 Tax=Timema douglasi TaxID=61478 RepID=A0A7R8VD66_TIMDO|nr:unnamed protein product [Timema douglasi]